MARMPTVADVTTFTSKFFPQRSGDVQYIYHRPFARHFDASQHTLSSIVLSVTPTRGFYDSLHKGAQVGFLHRPFGLDRRNVPKHATILACHKAFDEVLTVGCNEALAERLGLDVRGAASIQGYKNDPERRIGIVASLIDNNPSAAEVRDKVLSQYNGRVEGAFGFEVEGDGAHNEASPDDVVKTVAIMNAFHPAEVDRVIDVVRERQTWPALAPHSNLLYLTGAVREAGLSYAREMGMKVICVGHRACEDWGIAYLARQLHEQYPDIQIEEIYEDEETSNLNYSKNNDGQQEKSGV